MDIQSSQKAQIVRVASVQMESKPGDKETNFRTIESFVARAANQGVKIIVFPECSITGYWFIRNLTSTQLGQLAEPIFDGISSQRLSKLAKKYEIGI
jgi:predicted amidohydrolase